MTLDEATGWVVLIGLAGGVVLTLAAFALALLAAWQFWKDI